MWRKLLFSVILCVTILSVVQASYEELNKCIPGGEEYEVCVNKNAICFIKNDTYVCECANGMKMDKDGHCEVVGRCRDDSKEHRYCQSMNADCKESPENSSGFVCVCPEGKLNVENFCIDKPDQMVVTTTTSATFSSLSSSASSTPNVENTPSETSEASLQGSYFTFTTLQPTQVSSSSSVSSTTLNESNHGSSTSAPESGMLDWPMSAKITMTSLLIIIVILSTISAYLFHRFLKIRKSQQLEQNQVVYKKEYEGLHTDSVREPLQSGVVVVSYVLPSKKLSKINSFIRSSPC